MRVEREISSPTTTRLPAVLVHVCVYGEKRTSTTESTIFVVYFIACVGVAVRDFADGR